MPTGEEEKKKREIFEAMLPRRQERILRKGYDEWNPFQEPKEPLERLKQHEDEKERSRELLRSFFQEVQADGKSDEYVQGVFEMCRGILRNDNRFRGMYDFCCWYAKKQGEEP
jgi:hypothetical protein